MSISTETDLGSFVERAPHKEFGLLVKIRWKYENTTERMYFFDDYGDARDFELKDLSLPKGAEYQRHSVYRYNPDGTVIHIKKISHALWQEVESG